MPFLVIVSIMRGALLRCRRCPATHSRAGRGRPVRRGTPRPSRTAGAAGLLIVLGLLSAGACAEDFSLRSLASDAGQFVTAPARWDAVDWTAAGLTVVAIAGAHELDGRVRRHFADPYRPLDGSDRHSTRDAAPAALLVAGTLVSAWWLHDRDGYNETFSMLEAGAFSAISAEAFKFAAGRLRPSETTSPDRWRAGGSSFPSLHATAAFAIGTVFAESGNDDYRWLRRVIGYGIGLGTSYIRVKDSTHWLSDVVAGSALGISTARFVLNRHGNESRSSSFQVQPLGDGLVVGYVRQFR